MNPEPTNPSPAHYRLFVEVETPEAVKAELEKAQQVLRSELPGSATRWVKPDQFHLTLKFLGNVDAEKIEALTAALTGVSASYPSLNLRALGIGAFPNLRRPRVLWAGVEDEDGHLLPMQRAIEEAVAPFTNEKAEERFHGHLTLARFNQLNPGEIQAIERFARSLTDHAFGQWEANAIHLMRSELSSQGARHTVVALLPLAKKPA